MTSLPLKDVLIEGTPSLAKMTVLLAIFTILGCDEKEFPIECAVEILKILDGKLIAEVGSFKIWIAVNTFKCRIVLQ